MLEEDFCRDYGVAALPNELDGDVEIDLAPGEPFCDQDGLIELKKSSVRYSRLVAARNTLSFDGHLRTGNGL